MKPSNYILCAVLMGMALFFLVCSFRELTEDLESREYRDLSKKEIFVSKSSQCLAGIGLAAFCIVAARQAMLEQRGS